MQHAIVSQEEWLAARKALTHGLELSMGVLVRQ
jgi:hypothetical protein